MSGDSNAPVRRRGKTTTDEGQDRRAAETTSPKSVGRRRRRAWYPLLKRAERAYARADCCDCDWSERGAGTRPSAYHHAGTRGHRVFVRTDLEYELRPKRRMRRP